MDIETFVKDGIMVPYSISWYDGENSFSYYLTDFDNNIKMIEHAIQDLMRKKIWELHNLYSQSC